MTNETPMTRRQQLILLGDLAQVNRHNGRDTLGLGAQHFPDPDIGGVIAPLRARTALTAHQARIVRAAEWEYTNAFPSERLACRRLAGMAGCDTHESIEVREMRAAFMIVDAQREQPGEMFNLTAFDFAELDAQYCVGLVHFGGIIPDRIAAIAYGVVRVLSPDDRVAALAFMRERADDDGTEETEPPASEPAPRFADQYPYLARWGQWAIRPNAPRTPVEQRAGLELSLLIERYEGRMVPPTLIPVMASMTTPVRHVKPRQSREAA